MSARTDFDVVIGGGGIVGAAVAALLATDERARDLKVALVDEAPATMPVAGEPEELRVSALSRLSQRLLIEVGAWDALAARAPCPYVRMRIWDSADPPHGSRTLVFDAAEIGEPDLGHIVDNRSVAAALLAVALRRGVTLLRTPIDAIALSPERASVSLGSRTLAVSLVVAADGARSRLREWAGIGIDAHAYGERAIVARLQPARPHGAEARQRFLAGGPLALLPLSEGAVSLVWTVPDDEARLLEALEDGPFGERVTEASAAVLGDLVPLGPRQSFELRRDHAATYSVARLALAGDAAHTVHPLAGQGANLGLLDAAVLVEELLLARGRGEDIGDPGVLGRYGRARRADNLMAAAALHGIHELYASRNPALSWLRRGGVALVNRAGPLKARLMREALGLAAQAPARLRAAPR